MANKFKWTPEEDNLLRLLREDHQIKSWISISEEINRIQKLRKRTAKQCRERYINYVRLANATQQTSGWSTHDQTQFQDLYRIHGPKWALIAREMKGRSQIFLKNRFYSSFRKMTRKINAVEQLNKTSKKRLLKYENLLRIIEADKQLREKEGGISGNVGQNQSFVSDLREHLLRVVWSQEEVEDEEIQKLIQKIHRFNSMFSYFGMRKVNFHCNSKVEDQLTLNSSDKNSNEGEAPENHESSSNRQASTGKNLPPLKKEDENLSDPCFDELLDLYPEEKDQKKIEGKEQNLEQELSFILKREYIPDHELLF